MHDSTGRCRRGHQPAKGEKASPKEPAGCDCTEFRARTMVDTNDVRFATQEPAGEQGAFLGVVNDDAPQDYA